MAISNSTNVTIGHVFNIHGNLIINNSLDGGNQINNQEPEKQKKTEESTSKKCCQPISKKTIQHIKQVFT